MTKSRSKSTSGVKVNIRRRLGEETPSASVAKRRRRLVKASPSIDVLVDSASGCKVLSFLDAFSGYNQIKMHPRDESKTAFMTETCSYCCKVMPFGLKNAGTTYQRLMDKVLVPRLGRNVYAYVDDMVVASKDRTQHVANLEELFVTISKYRLKLNPEKCVFGDRGR